MAKAAVQFTKDNEYYTPKYVVDYFGKFDYDPATTKDKAEEFGIPNYDTIATDGLKQDWTSYNRIWINPPFTLKHKFINKAVSTYLKAKNEIYILFPIEFLTTRQFYDTVKRGVRYKLYIPCSRINFESGLGKKGKSPAFGSIVVRLQDNNEVEYIYIPKIDIYPKQQSLFDL